MSGLELRILLWLVSVAGVIGAGWVLHSTGYKSGQADMQAKLDKARAEHLANVIEIERKASADIAAIAEQYEQEKDDARINEARVVADLRADNLRLRQYWTGCEFSRVPTATGPASEPDAAADDRAESAARIVRAAAECDAQVRGLQAVIRSWQ